MAESNETMKEQESEYGSVMRWEVEMMIEEIMGMTANPSADVHGELPVREPATTQEGKYDHG